MERHFPATLIYFWRFAPRGFLLSMFTIHQAVGSEKGLAFVCSDGSNLDGKLDSKSVSRL
jgi:hypothetical protein